jgi:hypothetical protein
LAVAEINEIGVIGGLDYEDQIIALLQRIAGVAGDDCEATGGMTGRLKGRKTGDGVSHIKHGSRVVARMVFEAKNSSLSLVQWDKERRESKENRDATAFIGFCKHLNDMPNKSRILTISPQEIILAFNPEEDDISLLFTVYHVIRVQTVARLGELDDLSIGRINGALEEAMKAIERFDQISKSASQVENAGRAIKININGLKEDMLSYLREAQSAVTTNGIDRELELTTMLEATDALEASFG